MVGRKTGKYCVRYFWPVTCLLCTGKESHDLLELEVLNPQFTCSVAILHVIADLLFVLKQLSNIFRGEGYFKIRTSQKTCIQLTKTAFARVIKYILWGLHENSCQCSLSQKVRFECSRVCMTCDRVGYRWRSIHSAPQLLKSTLSNGFANCTCERHQQMKPPSLTMTFSRTADDAAMISGDLWSQLVMINYRTVSVFPTVFYCFLNQSKIFFSTSSV